MHTSRNRESGHSSGTVTPTAPLNRSIMPVGLPAHGWHTCSGTKRNELSLRRSLRSRWIGLRRTRLAIDSIARRRRSERTAALAYGQAAGRWIPASSSAGLQTYPALSSSRHMLLRRPIATDSSSFIPARAGFQVCTRGLYCVRLHNLTSIIPDTRNALDAPIPKVLRSRSGSRDRQHR
jgi:hypothetical protein